MSLISLGRNVALDQRLATIGGRFTAEVPQDVKSEVDDTVNETRRSLLDTLAPWIPGDFVVTYGALLTAWTSLRSSFMWLLIVAGASAVTYVVLGAFAETGFKEADPEAARLLRKRLFGRTIAGFFVSVYAAVAIPFSGWYDFKDFRDNELQWIMTASLVAVALVFLLKGLQKRLSVSLGNG